MDQVAKTLPRALLPHVGLVDDFSADTPEEIFNKWQKNVCKVFKSSGIHIVFEWITEEKDEDERNNWDLGRELESPSQFKGWTNIDFPNKDICNVMQDNRGYSVTTGLLDMRRHADARLFCLRTHGQTTVRRDHYQEIAQKIPIFVWRDLTNSTMYDALDFHRCPPYYRHIPAELDYGTMSKSLDDERDIVVFTQYHSRRLDSYEDYYYPRLAIRFTCTGYTECRDKAYAIEALTKLQKALRGYLDKHPEGDEDSS